MNLIHFIACGERERERDRGREREREEYKRVGRRERRTVRKDNRMSGIKESLKEGRNLTPVVDDVSATSIVMPARPGSSGAAVGTMAVRIKFSLFVPFLLVTLLCSLFSLDTRIDSEVKHGKAKVEAESSGYVSSLTS